MMDFRSKRENKKERNQGARKSRLTFEKAYKAEALDQEL